MYSCLIGAALLGLHLKPRQEQRHAWRADDILPPGAKLRSGVYRPLLAAAPPTSHGTIMAGLPSNLRGHFEAVVDLRGKVKTLLSDGQSKTRSREYLSNLLSTLEAEIHGAALSKATDCAKIVTMAAQFQSVATALSTQVAFGSNSKKTKDNQKAKKRKRMRHTPL